jgi:membrane protein implicated in regulation of membrane protease activity
MELIFPTAFVAFMMGISAIITALIALILPSLGLQIIIWLTVATLLIVLSRRWVTRFQARKQSFGDDPEGQTLTPILPGHSGRVLYEGNSWRARCADEQLAIAAQEKVYIVSRQGNTLMVVPLNYLNSNQ